MPSYCHRNWLAAWVSWRRLFAAVELARRNRADARRALDFGASVGELGHLLLPGPVAYDFIERDQPAVDYLASRLPDATRRTLADAPDGAYDWVFAIDALEHNDDYADLLARLAAKLGPEGILVLSGPTENRLYRLGRRIAGFSGHYHVTNIHHIEACAARFLRRADAATILPGLPLFRLSVWRRP